MVDVQRTVFVLEDHAPVGALGDTLRRALGTHEVTVFGVEGWPACGTPHEALRHHGLDGASLADRIAAAGTRPRAVTARRVWIVLPDLLSIRVFFDTGIVDGLRERLDGAIAAVFLVPEADARAWVDRLGETPALQGAELAASSGGLGERTARRVDAALDRQLGYYPLAIRLNRRHGFHSERMQPGHPNWMLDSSRDGLAAALRPASSARCSGGSSARDATFRGDFSRRCAPSAPRSSSRTCSRRASCRTSPPRADSSSPSSPTSRAGITPSARA